MIRLGVIGIGNMGSVHAANVAQGKCPDFVLTAMADINAERLAWAKENISGEAALFDDAIQMLDSGLIDACIVSIPHYDHARYAIECMKRGIHVMVEKPAGVYTKQVREMNEEAASRPEVVFAMMFNQRTNHVYRKMHELVHSGKYGQLRRANWIITNWYRPQAYYDSGAWRATWSGEGGGVLLNQCPHQLDMLQWICGMPEKVHAHLHMGLWHDIEVEDDVTAYLEYPNGATGVFVTTTGDAHGTNRFEVQLESAKIVAETQTDGETTLYVEEFDMPEPEWSRTNKVPFGTMPSHAVEIETDGENSQHIGVINAWGGNILRGTPLVARGEEGINGLMLSNAMHLSAFLGKTIEMPVDEDVYFEELMKRVKTSRRKPETKSVFVDTSNTYGGTK